MAFWNTKLKIANLDMLLIAKTNDADLLMLLDYIRNSYMTQLTELLLIPKTIGKWCNHLSYLLVNI